MAKEKGKRSEVSCMKEQRCALCRNGLYPAVLPIQLSSETPQSNRSDQR